MRAIVGREGLDRPAASTSQMGRFETEWLATEANLALAGRPLEPCEGVARPKTIHIFRRHQPEER